MPLSKARMRERKRRDRFINRFDKHLSSPQTSNSVKPILHNNDSANQSARPTLDADGNIIPEY